MKIALVRRLSAKHWEAILFLKENKMEDDLVYFVESRCFARFKDSSEAFELSDQIKPDLLNLAFPTVYCAPWIDDLIKQVRAIRTKRAFEPDLHNAAWQRWRDLGVDAHSDRELVEVFHRKFPAPFFCCRSRDRLGALLPIVVVDGALNVVLEDGTLVPHDETAFTEPCKSKIKRFLLSRASTNEQKITIYSKHNPALDLRLYKKWLPRGEKKKKAKPTKRGRAVQKFQKTPSRSIARKSVSSEDLKKVELAAIEFKKKARADREAELLKMKKERAERRGSAVRPNSGGSVFPLGLASPEDLKRKFGPKYHKMKKVG